MFEDGVGIEDAYSCAGNVELARALHGTEYVRKDVNAETRTGINQLYKPLPITRLRKMKVGHEELSRDRRRHGLAPPCDEVDVVGCAGLRQVAGG